MNFHTKLCILSGFLIRICFGRTIDASRFDFKKNIIPFIIGTSLMGLVIIVLLGSLIVCFCRQKSNKKKEYKGVSQVPDDIKLVDFTHGRSSAIQEQLITTKKKLNDEVCEPKSETNLVGKSSFQLEKPRRYRRASVPATLSVLHEASSSMEAGSRKMSLSYNCVLEPMIDSKRNSVLLSESELTSRPENNTSSKSTSFLESILTEKSSEEKTNRYSIYEDDSIASDDLHSKHGKILFSLSYNLDAKTLDVTMKKAEYLSGQRVKGKNHFYVKLRLVKPAMVTCISSTSLSGITDQDSIKPSKHKKGSFRTSIKTDFCNPKFEETFKFMNVTSHTLKESILQFIIKEETPKFLEKNRIIGQVNFVLDGAQLIEKHEMISEIIRDILPVGPKQLADNFDRLQEETQAITDDLANSKVYLEAQVSELYRHTRILMSGKVIQGLPKQVEWEIDDIPYKFQQAADGRDPFITSEWFIYLDYRLGFKMYPCGTDAYSGTHMSILMFIIRTSAQDVGSVDKWITISVVDQMDGSTTVSKRFLYSSLVKEESTESTEDHDQNTPLGAIDFLPLETLRNSNRYIKDERMLIRANIESKESHSFDIDGM